jgi:hypothetical protein
MTHDIIVNEAARWRNGARQVHGSGVVKSLELTGSGPVGLVHTQKFQFLKQKTHVSYFPEPAWPKARPLLFCRETARYYHRLFAAT